MLVNNNLGKDASIEQKSAKFNQKQSETFYGGRPKEVYTSPGPNRRDDNFSQPRQSNVVNSDNESPDIYKRRVNRGDLTSWGGFDYNNNPNDIQLYSLSKGKKSRVSVNKNTKLNRGNIKIQPLGNRIHYLNTNSVNIIADNGTHFYE